MGDVMGDLNSRRAKIEGMNARGKYQELKAQVPLAEVLTYAPTLTSITSGRGTFSLSFSHLDPVPYAIQEKIVEEAKRQKMQNNDSDATRSLFQSIQGMSVSEKLDLARKAGKEARSILMRDTNRLVQLAVIDSPKITESEVLLIASNRQIHDEVLRHISTNREWMKNYQIKLALVNNPKTPLPIALKQMPYLKQRDLALLAKSRAVPRAIVISAQQRLREVKR